MAPIIFLVGLAFAAANTAGVLGAPVSQLTINGRELPDAILVSRGAEPIKPSGKLPETRDPSGQLWSLSSSSTGSRLISKNEPMPNLGPPDAVYPGGTRCPFESTSMNCQAPGPQNTYHRTMDMTAHLRLHHSGRVPAGSKPPPAINPLAESPPPPPRYDKQGYLLIKTGPTPKPKSKRKPIAEKVGLSRFAPSAPAPPAINSLVESPPPPPRYDKQGYLLIKTGPAPKPKRKPTGKVGLSRFAPSQQPDSKLALGDTTESQPVQL